MKSILFALAALISTTGFAAEKKIVRGTDRFELVYQLTVPKLTQAGTLWLPLARTDAHQKFEVLAIHSPIGWHKTRDAAGQNEVLVIEPTPADSGQRITIRYQVTRKEKASHAEAGDPKTHLKAERLVPLNARFTKIATAATGKANDDFTRGRALYRHVLEHMRYSKAGQGWGRG